MTIEELVAKQQLEIEHYRMQSDLNAAIKKQIIGKAYNVGQPLNDNILGFDSKQQKWVWDVVKLTEELQFGGVEA